MYVHFSQCNTVNKEKELSKTCQICVVQKFKSGIPYERSWVDRTTLVILQQIFAQKASVKCPNFASRPNFATFGYWLPRYTDVLWKLHTNCQNITMFGQANGTLKIFKLFPWLLGLPWKQQPGGEVRICFRYGRKNKKLASIKNKWFPWVEKAINLINNSYVQKF